MLVEIRERAQLTIPRDFLKRIGLSIGDKVELIERDGGIFLCPVVVYPKAKLESIAKIIKEHENTSPAVYESIEDMFTDMGINLGEDNV